MIASYFTHKCPTCGFPFANTWFTADLGVRLGPGYAVCYGCKGRIPDGSKEWPELSSVERLRLFVPLLVWPFLFVMLVPAVVTSLKDDGGIDPAKFAAAAAIILAALPVLLSPYWVYRGLQARKSLRRHAGDEEALADLGPASSWTPGGALSVACVVLFILFHVGRGGYDLYRASSYRRARIEARFSGLAVGQSYEDMLRQMGEPPSDSCDVRERSAYAPPADRGERVGRWEIYRVGGHDFRARFDGLEWSRTAPIAALESLDRGSPGYCE